MHRLCILLVVVVLSAPMCPLTEANLTIAFDHHRLDKVVAVAPLDVTPPHDDHHSEGGSTAPAAWTMQVAFVSASPVSTITTF
jgi:hypothetical protein